MGLNSDLKKALTVNDFTLASNILLKRPFFGEKADINKINLADTGLLDELIHFYYGLIIEMLMQLSGLWIMELILMLLIPEIYAITLKSKALPRW